ncbi:PA0069 family radical SAM protein [Rhodohalobacter sulfatireducens]|uniref:PA0069 family radical SAM protein n=1 Tax=Rhodohalobacter sulfatireducens TaxID=2911366 RepID=A0ABS9KAS8_9BACT|nr:PA0069 family radical SAM protein [Rhodohalobacter sulfatireducens]MCG2587957.1 PA0069 family radical SAM protein [Rhodohalobacter sulfatireducens]
MKPIKGRGSAHNPKNRFKDTHLEYDINEETGKFKKPDTQLLTDHTSEIISTNQSPDISFDVSLNPYRGCEHGCVYCYARPTHEYLGMSPGLDFESKIVVKYDAPKLLREKLAQECWKPQTLIMSGVTDPYQPIEKKLRITRGCIEVLAECNHPLVIITKNYQVTRDIDLLLSLAEKNAVKVVLSITSLDKSLTDTMEPRTSRPNRRLKAVRELTEAGIPVHVNIAPLIPGLTDEELVPIMEASAEAGAGSVAVVPLRLPYAVKDLFVKWLEDHQPDRKKKVINRIKNMKDGKLNRSEWGERFQVEGPFGDQIRQLLKIHAKRLGLNKNISPLETKHFRRPETDQLRLF